MQFAELVAIEPRLASLAERVVVVRRLTSLHMRELAWYREFKIEMAGYVGFHAKDKRLQSEQAYNAAYSYLIDLLDI